MDYVFPHRIDDQLNTKHLLSFPAVCNAEHAAHWAISYFYSAVFFSNVTFDLDIGNTTQRALVKVYVSYRQ